VHSDASFFINHPQKKTKNQPIIISITTQAQLYNFSPGRTLFVFPICPASFGRVFPRKILFTKIDGLVKSQKPSIRELWNQYVTKLETSSVIPDIPSTLGFMGYKGIGFRKLLENELGCKTSCLRSAWQPARHN
jgi:hypothetical protein